MAGSGLSRPGDQLHGVLQRAGPLANTGSRAGWHLRLQRDRQGQPGRLQLHHPGVSAPGGARTPQRSGKAKTRFRIVADPDGTQGGLWTQTEARFLNGEKWSDFTATKKTEYARSTKPSGQRSYSRSLPALSGRGSQQRVELAVRLPLRIASGSGFLDTPVLDVYLHPAFLRTRACAGVAQFGRASHL